MDSGPHDFSCWEVSEIHKEHRGEIEEKNKEIAELTKDLKECYKYCFARWRKENNER